MQIRERFELRTVARIEADDARLAQCRRCALRAAWAARFLQETTARLRALARELPLGQAPPRKGLASRPGGRRGCTVTRSTGASNLGEPRDLATAEGFADYFRTIGEGSRYTHEQFLSFFAPVEPEPRSRAERGRARASATARSCSTWSAIALRASRASISATWSRRPAASSACSRESSSNLQHGDLTTADLGPHDFAYCIGVIHHLQEPEAGFDALLRHAEDGGRLPRLDLLPRGQLLRHPRGRRDPQALRAGCPGGSRSGARASPSRRCSSCTQGGRLAGSAGRRQAWFARCRCTTTPSAWPGATSPSSTSWRPISSWLGTPVYLDRAALEAWLRHPEVEPGSTYLIHRNGNSWSFGGRRRALAIRKRGGQMLIWA